MKKKIVYLFAACMLTFTLTACGGTKKEASSNETKTEETTTSGTETAESTATTPLNDYIGQPLVDYMAKADELQYTSSYFADGVDFTSFIDSLSEDYLVGDLKINEEEKTVEVTLALIANAEADAALEELKGKIEEGSAWIAAENYGKSQFGEDFELHYLLGKIDASAEDADTWSLKAECTVSGSDMTCEAKVTGTADAPEVIFFDVY